MPKRTDISTILIIGSGPIVIGQACEFDYSGTQAVQGAAPGGLPRRPGELQPGHHHDRPGDWPTPPTSSRLTVEMLERIIAQERPDALLPTVGGQTGLNLAWRWRAAASGPLRRRADRRQSARRSRWPRTANSSSDAMPPPGWSAGRAAAARSLVEAGASAEQAAIRSSSGPAFTLGGSGAGTVFTPGRVRRESALGAIAESPVGQVLVEESLMGWKEYELEVMRDRAGNFVVVCSIENLDAMGVHTGDSITVAPAQTLTDKEYQRLRDQARQVMRAVGVETGGSNVQFGVDPASGRVVIIEMNPRVSRSSALASKATGFPSPSWRRWWPWATRWTN
jgi:carbamoyl-phosphate synthase large subunit